MHEFDLDYERPYVVMEYIEGSPYDHMLADGTMHEIPLQTRCEALHQVGRTLTEAHRKGIIHRDIKPGNIRGFYPPYLLDFGIALQVKELAQARNEPEVGTGIYMPPAGEPIDALSDVYSFAVVVYEVLLGQHPIFTPQTIDKTVIGTRQRAGELLQKRAWRIPGHIPDEELPPELRGCDLSGLDGVFERAFGRRRKRHKTPLAFLDDLNAALAAALLTAPADGTISQAAQRPPAQPIPTEQRFTEQEASRDQKRSRRLFSALRRLLPVSLGLILL